MSPVFYEIHSSNLARFQNRDIFRSIPNFLMTRKIQPAKQQGQCSYAGYIGFLVSAEFKWEMENGATSAILFSSLCTFPITPPHCITTTLDPRSHSLCMHYSLETRIPCHWPKVSKISLRSHVLVNGIEEKSYFKSRSSLSNIPGSLPRGGNCENPINEELSVELSFPRFKAWRLIACGARTTKVAALH